MTKLLVIVALAGAVAHGLTRNAEPPLLIDSQPAPALDANR